MTEPLPRPEKRGNARDPVRREVKLEIPPQILEGVTRDASADGAFLFFGADVEVRVALAHGSEQIHHRARIVRLEPVPGGGIGLAVEFINEPVPGPG